MQLKEIRLKKLALKSDEDTDVQDACRVWIKLLPEMWMEGKKQYFVLLYYCI